jgi:hypothetical protein
VGDGGGAGVEKMVCRVVVSDDRDATGYDGGAGMGAVAVWLCDHHGTQHHFRLN